MATPVTPSPFITGFRLTDGSQLNSNFGHPLLSFQDAVTAHANGGQTNAFQITTRVVRLSTVGTAADSVKLQANPAGKVVYIINDTATSATVYGFGTDTINDVATATGVPLPANSIGTYTGTVGGTAGKWYAIISALTTTGTPVVPAQNRGTFVANSGTAVTVTNANITANSVVSVGLKTVGGTPAAPFMVTVTPGTGFTINSGGSDTSTYNYAIVG